MFHPDKEWIKNWKPYKNAFDLTSEIIDQFNHLLEFRNKTSNFSIENESYLLSDFLSHITYSIRLRLFKGNNTPPDVLKTLFNLTKSNMKRMYDENRFYGGWTDRKKLSELKYYKTHIIGIFNDEILIGFASYRFVVMRECQPPTPVLYIYELQILESFRGQGLGKFIILLLQFVAKAVSCTKLMCTVFRSNPRALSFYAKCNFVGDESDPDREYRVLKLPL